MPATSSDPAVTADSSQNPSNQNPSKKPKSSTSASGAAVSDEAILRSVTATLTTEAAAIDHKIASLDGAVYGDAVRALLGISGKLVVTGMGKSGHVGRKVAATLASTGTAAFFVHPAEAMHGDLGMITRSDGLLAIAHGGETSEVLGVARHAKALGVPIIALTGKSSSSLAQLSDYVLDGSVVAEACPLNLAPTSSTTVAMAIGDSLAVALMNARGFDDHDFAKVHPSGSLGRRLAAVTDLMIPAAKLTTLAPDSDIHQVLEAVTHGNTGLAVVVSSQGALAGVISDGDLRRAMVSYQQTIFSQTAASLMTTQPKVIAATELAQKGANIMEAARITSLVVVDSERRFCGILKLHSLK